MQYLRGAFRAQQQLWDTVLPVMLDVFIQADHTHVFETLVHAWVRGKVHR